MSNNKISETLRNYYANLKPEREVDEELDELLTETDEAKAFNNAVLKRIEENNK
jgi:hypothetical protein